MKYSISDTSGVSFATVTSSKLKTFVAYISVDIHEEQTARLRAVRVRPLPVAAPSRLEPGARLAPG